MKKKISKRLVNGTAYLFSVVLLLSMLAAPVVASVTANSVGSYHIKDNSILNRDIAPNKISSSRIKDYTIVKEDIHSASINKYKLTSNAVNTYKIEDGTIKDADLSTKKGWLSISPGTLSPLNGGYDYTKGSSIRLNSGTVGSFYAPVQLPDGAVVEKLSYTAWDENGGVLEYTSALLTRIRNSNTAPQYMATASTNGLASSSSWRTISDNSISDPIIDNAVYAYHVQVYLSDPSNLFGGNVVIEYTYKR